MKLFNDELQRKTGKYLQSKTTQTNIEIIKQLIDFGITTSLGLFFIVIVFVMFFGSVDGVIAFLQFLK